MIHLERSGSERPALFCLHYLGGSAREWNPVGELLRDRMHVVALDLPGFGDAAQTPGYSIAEMAETIVAVISAASPHVWMIAGHSMGAKVAAALARSAEDGDRRLAGLTGIVMIAGSPPSPEPIPDADRAEMLGWFSGDAQSDRADAERYVTKNTGPALNAETAEVAIGDVLRANRAAWIAWLERGSREDWSARVGIVQTPTLLVSGALDANLGPDAQRRLMAPHFANVRLLTVPDAKHVLPLETPQTIARAIHEHLTFATYHALIASERVGQHTRTALLERTVRDDRDDAEAALGSEAIRTLRAVIDRVIPQHEGPPIDLAARIDRQLAAGVGDGWRFADLPPDADAYRIALRTLDASARARHGHPFAMLDSSVQDEMLREIAAGDSGSTPAHGSTNERFDAAQMQEWFEDLRADAVKLYVAHPQTLAHLGYSGIANGGDGLLKSGFIRVGLDERETWEPHPYSDVTL